MSFILRHLWSNITIIENIKISREELFWKEWRDILLAEYDGRLAALGAKDYRNVPARETFTTIFLQVKDFSVPASDVLPEAIRIIKGKDVFRPLKELDAVAMLGHHIGILENSNGIKQYLQDIGPSLRPDGRLLFTSIDINRNLDSPNRTTPIDDNLQIQQVKLIGPFFALLRIKAEALQKQAVAANWQFEMLYRQDENSYAAQLNPCTPAL